MTSITYPWHEPLWNFFIQAEAQHRFPSASLWSYASLSEKIFFAKALSQYLLCHNKIKGKACETCEACHWFSEKIHPDFYEVTLEEKASQIRIDQIRTLVEDLSKTASQKTPKIVLLYPAETMNMAAQNALLKTLEEPLGQVYFFLLAHSPQHVLPTIRSRCQKIEFKNPSKEQGIAWLQQKKIENPEIYLVLANQNPILALDYEKKNLLFVLQQAGEKLQALFSRKINAIELAESIKESDRDIYLSALSVLIPILMRRKLGVTELDLTKHLNFLDQLLSLISFDHLKAFYDKLIFLNKPQAQALNQTLLFEHLFIEGN